MNETITAQSSLLARLMEYLELCKPRIVIMLVFTAWVGMFLATPDLVPVLIFFAGGLGIGLASASSAVINHIADRRFDAMMIRTRGRPLPQHRLSLPSAVIFAFVLGTAATLILVLLVNLLTAALALSALIGYGFIYTLYLKHATSQNIVIGGAAGAAPPVLGWTAVTGTLDPQALLLFLIVFAWTPPHFWALAIHRHEDYRHAGIPMLPVTHGLAFTRLHILLYTVITVIASLLPSLTWMSGRFYLGAALLLGGGFLYFALRMQVDHRACWALRTFRYSIYYLLLLFAALLIDHYLPAPLGAAIQVTII